MDLGDTKDLKTEKSNGPRVCSKDWDMRACRNSIGTDTGRPRKTELDREKRREEKGNEGNGRNPMGI